LLWSMNVKTGFIGATGKGTSEAKGVMQVDHHWDSEKL
jgi:hypothetical protein